MSKCCLIVTLTLFLALSTASRVQGQSVPRFSDYPAGPLYKGKTAKVKITRANRNFKTRLRWAARDVKPNFAGRYIVTTWGCGSDCIMGGVLDARTGQVYSWDFTVCCWRDARPVEFRPDSRLIVFSGLRNEKEGDDGAHYYVFNGTRFKYLRTVTQKE